MGATMRASMPAPMIRNPYRYRLPLFFTGAIVVIVIAAWRAIVG